MKKGEFFVAMMRKGLGGSVLVFLLSLFFSACGGGSGGNGGGGGGGGGSAPSTPTGLTATAGTGQVMLSWSASSGATSYHVKRGTASGGPYAQVAAPTATSYTDTNVTAGTAYFYVVSALNASGESANSAQASATPTAASTAVSVNVDVMTNRHFISPYVYGVNFPPNASYIGNSNTSLVRWGGNASSTYNWKISTYNADNDFFFEDFTFCGFGSFSNCTDSDSIQWITDVKAQGSTPLMTMVMLPWVAQSAEVAGAGGNLHWVYSVSQDGACGSKVDQFNTDASVALKADCSTPFVASQAQLNRAYFPLLDGPPQTGDPANSIYRNQWAAALATAFGSGNCGTTYFTNPSCHFYDMDNEIDIWNGTHFDVHPNPPTYDELRDVYLTETGKLKTWDPQAVGFGWVSCCWGPYWGGGQVGSDKTAHASVDFMPWWINEVFWNDQISGIRTLDVLDLHAYPETSGTGLSLSQQRTLALTDTHDWWDPTYTSQAWFGSVDATNEQPNDRMPFRIPRIRALLNSIYPGTPLAFTEWNFAMAGESDISTALADADAYGILGREGVTYATRWTAPDPSTPAYNSLLLYRNYDGAKGAFNPISVSATHDADPNLFSVYAATNPAGNSMTIMVVNKDPNNNSQVQFALNHFTPSSVTTYTLSQASPNSIVAGSSQAWPANSTMTFAPFSATLLVVGGTSSNPPASEWDLNPDAIMVPANGTVNLSPRIVTGSATVTLNSAVFDSFEGASACNSGSISLTNPTVAVGTPGTIAIGAPATPGFCHFTVTASDGTSKGGWVVAGKPAATLSKTGDNQSGAVGTNLTLSVTLAPGSSGGTAAGASVLFTTSTGSLANVRVGSEQIFNGAKAIAVTNSSGVATVTLTLPATAGAVNVQAEGPYGLGHPVVTFTETAN